MPDTNEVLKSIDTESAGELAMGYGLDELEFVAMQTGKKHRWYTDMLVVFKVKGEDDLYGFDYFDPATEMQEGDERFVADPVPVFPVAAQEVTRTEYLAAR
jgi:hypothetical protein